MLVTVRNDEKGKGFNSPPSPSPSPSSSETETEANGQKRGPNFPNFDAKGFVQARGRRQKAEGRERYYSCCLEDTGGRGNPLRKELFRVSLGKFMRGSRSAHSAGNGEIYQPGKLLTEGRGGL